ERASGEERDGGQSRERGLSEKEDLMCERERGRVIMDVNGVRIEQKVIYHSLSRHLKCSSSSFPASGSILPSSASPRIPTISAETHQP
ncbi:hypothetical protein A2U01_0069619, partial [Trifolium medium]|nr:hypothetical protein [Trifolium medium]